MDIRFIIIIMSMIMVIMTIDLLPLHDNFVVFSLYLEARANRQVCEWIG